MESIARRKSGAGNTQELRAVLRGWPGDASPGLVFVTVPVLSLEAFMSRATGKRGAMCQASGVQSQRQEQERRCRGVVLLWWMLTTGNKVAVHGHWHWIRTWRSQKDFEDEMVEALAEEMAEQILQSMLGSGLI